MILPLLQFNARNSGGRRELERGAGLERVGSQAGLGRKEMISLLSAQRVVKAPLTVGRRSVGEFYARDAARPKIIKETSDKVTVAQTSLFRGGR